MNVQEIQSTIVAMAHNDQKFRESLKADPRATLKDLFGLDLPTEVDIKVVEETPTTCYLVLPVVPDSVPDEAVEAVAGGSAFENRGRWGTFSVQGYEVAEPMNFGLAVLGFNQLLGNAFGVTADEKTKKGTYKTKAVPRCCEIC